MALFLLNFPDVLSDENSLATAMIPGTQMGAWPSWSPDGTQIVYRQELPGNDEIFVIDADGSNPLNLTRHPANDFSPDWSPDGRDLRRLTEHPLEDQHPRWSPDGTAILYSHHGELYLMNPDGSNSRRLAGKLITGNFAEWRACQESS